MRENGGAKATIAAWDALQAHQHGHIVACRSGCTHAAERGHTAATHSISTAAARDTAYEPRRRLRRVLALDGFMADAAQEALLRMSGSRWQQRQGLQAMRACTRKRLEGSELLRSMQRLECSFMCNCACAGVSRRQPCWLGVQAEAAAAVQQPSSCARACATPAPLASQCTHTQLAAFRTRRKGKRWVVGIADQKA